MLLEKDKNSNSVNDNGRQHQNYDNVYVGCLKRVNTVNV